MSPVYEDETHRAAEGAVLANVGRLLPGVEIHRTPQFCAYDATTTGAASLVFEVKCRENTKETYDPFVISWSKVVAGLEKAEEVGGLYYILVRWTNGLWRLDVERAIDFGNTYVADFKNDRGVVDKGWFFPIREGTVYPFRDYDYWDAIPVDITAPM